MPDAVIHLFSALPAAPAAGGAAAPEWVHLLPAGTFKGVDGRGPYHLVDADQVIAASMAAGKLPIDENHATDLLTPKGMPAPARGWIVEMQARPDGIWGRAEWTPSGQQLVAEQSYRGLSPVITLNEKTGRVVNVLSVSLTNRPNLPQLTTLHTRGSDMDLSKLREALGLAADADEAAILAAATAARTAIAAHTADLARIAAAAGLAADAAAQATPDGLVVHLQAVAATGKTEAELRGTVIGLQTKLSTLETDRARELAERAVDKAIADGKPIKPMRDHYIERHTKDPAGVTKELAALPSINAGGTGDRRDPGASGADGLTDGDRQVAQAMGIDPAAYAKTLADEKKELI